MKSNVARGYSIALLSAAVLSTTAILVRLLTANHHLPPLLLAFWRATFATLTLLLVLFIARRRLLKVSTTQLGFLLAYGFLLAVFNSLWTFSVALNGAAVSNVLVYCSTAFTVLLGWWLLKERLTWVKILTVIICLTGTAFISQVLDPAAWKVNFGGILTGILSGLGYAVYSLMGRVASQRGLNPWTALLYIFIISAACLGILNLLPVNIPGTAQGLEHFLALGNDLTGWGILLVLAAVPTVLGYGLYNVSLTYLPSSTVNLIATCEPVLTVVTAFLLLGERMTGVQMMGGLMILGGVVFMRLFEGRLPSEGVQPVEKIGEI
jgi:drug/metabolite transporter (DMT)-like permease